MGKAFEKEDCRDRDYAQFIFMDYYCKIKYVLNKYCVASKDNYFSDVDEKSFHPLIENKSIGKYVYVFLDPNKFLLFDYRID